MRTTTYSTPAAFVSSLNSFSKFVEVNPPHLKPKQLGLVHGKVVVRTYDVDDPNRKYDFAFQFEEGVNKSLPEHMIFRDDHNNIRRYVEHRYNNVKWVDAAGLAL